MPLLIHSSKFKILCLTKNDAWKDVLKALLLVLLIDENVWLLVCGLSILNQWQQKSHWESVQHWSNKRKQRKNVKRSNAEQSRIIYIHVFILLIAYTLHTFLFIIKVNLGLWTSDSNLKKHKRVLTVLLYFQTENLEMSRGFVQNLHKSALCWVLLKLPESVNLISLLIRLAAFNPDIFLWENVEVNVH